MSDPLPIAVTQNGLIFDGPDVGLAAKKQRKWIQNWAGRFNRSSGLWVPADDLIAEDSGVPPEWHETDFPFRYKCENSAAQVYAYDTKSPNPCSLLIRLARWPQKLLQIQAQGADPSGHTVFPEKRAIRFDSPWDGVAALWWQAKRDGVRKLLECDPSVWGGFVDFWMKIPEQAELIGRAVYIGSEAIFRFLPSYAWDSTSGDRNGPWGFGPTFPVQMSKISESISDGYRLIRIRLSVPAENRAAAVGTLFVDPTVTIGGAADPAALSDAMLLPNNYNYGLSDRLNCCNANTVLYRSILRIADIADIPSGAIDAIRYIHARTWFSLSQNGGTLECYAIKDANSNWVEGTVNGAYQEGSVSGLWVVSASQAWAGSQQCGTKGTDHDNTPSGSLVYAAKSGSSSDDINTLTFSETQSMEDMRDGIRNNAGWVFRGDAATEAQINSFYLMRSSEYTPANKLEVDYTAAGFHPAVIFGRRS